jgi:hypothetical protein
MIKWQGVVDILACCFVHDDYITRPNDGAQDRRAAVLHVITVLRLYHHLAHREPRAVSIIVQRSMPNHEAAAIWAQILGGEAILPT